MSGHNVIKTLFAAATAAAALLCAPFASAATYTIPGQMPPGGCTLTTASPAVITCTNLNLQNGDVMNVSAPTTINVTGSFNSATNLSVNQSGNAANLTINANNSITIGQGSRINGSISTNGSVNFNFDTRVGGNVTAVSNISLAQQTQIGGNVVSTAGQVNGNQTQVIIGGYVQAANAVQLGQSVQVGGYVVSVNNNVSINSGTIGGYIQALNGTVTTVGQNQNTTTIGGAITAKGTVQLGTNHVVSGGITSATGGITTGEEVHVNGNVLAQGDIVLGQDAVGHTTVTGNVQSYGGKVTTRLRVRILGYVTAHGNIELGQQSNIGLNVTSATGTLTTFYQVIIGGGVDTAGAISLGQATVIGQNVQSDAGVSLEYGVVINGGIQAAGNVSVGQNSVIDDDVESGGNVNTQYGVTIGGGIITTGNVNLGQNTSVGDFIQADGSVTAGGPGVTVGQYINSTGLGGSPITSPPGAPPLVTCDTDPTGQTSQNHESCPGWTDPSAPAVSQYRISYVDSAVLTCEMAQITVTACADGNCTSKATSATNSFTLTASGAGLPTISSGPVSLVAGEKVVSLPLNVAGTYTLSLSLSPAQCYPDTSCTLDVNQAGFTWQIDPLQRAGVPFPSVSLHAEACAGVIPANTAMDLTFSIDQCVNPTSCSASYLKLDGLAALTTSGTFGSGNIPMNARFRYDDAGKIRLKAHAELANGIVLEGTSPAFVVRPDSIGFTFAGALSSDTYAKAGDSFTVQLRALNAFGNVTPNFGRETPAEKLIFAETVNVPAGQPGDVSGASGFSFDGTNNVFTNATLAYSESGYASFIAQAASGDYLGSGDNLAQSSAQLRFVPWAFAVNSSSMGDPHSTYCSAPGYGYMGQDLGLYVGVTAVNKQGARTYNYQGTQARARARVYVVDPDDNHADLSSRLDVAPITIGWSLGQGTVSSMSVAFARDTAPDGPYEGLQYAIAIEHREVVNDSALGALVLPTQPAGGYAHTTLPVCVAGTVCDAVAVADPLRMLYGKLVLADTYGPEDSAAPVNLEVHYWNDDTQQFARHIADSCTAVDFENLVMQASLGASVKQGDGEINVDRGRSPVGALRWSAPLVEGSFMFSYTAPDWLKDEDGEDPTARATFGRYRGHDRVLSWQLLPLPPE
jgi:predicted acyltransferase (DUF342 family)